MLKVVLLLIFSSTVSAGGSGLAHIGPLKFVPIILVIVVAAVIIWALWHFVSGTYKTMKEKNSCIK